MLYDANGRRRSKRTLEEDVNILTEEFESLTDDEKALLAAMLEGHENGETALVQQMYESRYRWTPVPMDQFLDDEYYLGTSCSTLYPKLRKDLIHMFETGDYREAVCTGSIGWGKTTFLSIAMCRMLYELSCLRAPQAAFGLSPGSEMVMVLLSKTLALAKSVMKTAVDDKLKLSGYFKEKFKPTFLRDVTRFPNNIVMVMGSVTSDSILGMNVFAGAMDEANFMATRGEVIKATAHQKKTIAQYDLAEKTYAGLARRS